MKKTALLIGVLALIGGVGFIVYKQQFGKPSESDILAFKKWSLKEGHDTFEGISDAEMITTMQRLSKEEFKVLQRLFKKSDNMTASEEEHFFILLNKARGK